MAAFEVIALDTATPQLRAPGASDTYTFPRAVEMPLGTANGVLYLNGSKVVSSGSGLVYDSSGNLGLGVTPSAWSLGKAIEVNNAGNALWGVAASEIDVSQNAYYNGGWKYAASSYASRYEQNTGVHKWWTAPSGTAGDPISFSQALTLDAFGNLMAGVTSTTFRINATVASGADQDIFAAQIAGASNGLTIKWNHATTTTRVNISNLPTSATGLASGDLWNDGGTLKIA
jgi:hypothetical protein